MISAIPVDLICRAMRSIAPVLLVAAGAATSAIGEPAIPGTAVLSGTVTADKPFTAAQVYAKNLDKYMLYTVYTHNGRYRAPNLLPGGYRIWAEKDGLTSRHEMLRIHDEGAIELDLEMRPGPDNPLTLKDPSKPGPQFGGAGPDAQLVSYDEMYPPGPGRDLVEPSCLICHGHSFLPANRMNRVQWHAMISVMLDPNGAFADPDSVRSITDQEHEILADYLVENFGPDSPPKVLRLDVEYPLDEATLASAMFIEYLTPLHPAADLSQRSANEPFKHRIHRPMMDNDGNLWGSNSLIGLSRVDPRTSQWSHFPIGYDENNPETDMYGRKKGEPGSIWSYIFPHDLTISRDGHVFWAEFQGQHLGRLDPATGDQKEEYDVPRYPFSRLKASMPYGIVADPDDRIWFGDGGLGGALIRFDPETEQFTYYPEPRQADNPNLDVTREGAIIFSTRSNNQAALGIFYPDVSRMTGYGAYR